MTRRHVRTTVTTALLATLTLLGALAAPVGAVADGAADGVADGVADEAVGGGDDAPMLWGAHPNPRPGESVATAHARVTAQAGRQLEAVRMFYLWDESSDFPGAVEQDVLDSGGTLVISVKPQTLGGAVVSWSDVAAAQPGSAIYQRMVAWAAKVRAIGEPVYVTFHHEPEAKANLSYGDVADYLAAWRRWVTVFRDQGATNARFQWIMTDQSFWLPATDRRAAARWYPGDAWVDGIATDAYNWFECRPGIVNAWKSLETIITPMRDFALDHPDEELWLTEYGTVEDPARPGRKAQWYADARALFQRPDFAQLDGVMLFESVPRSTCTWSADTSSSALEAWRAWGADPAYAATDPPARPGEPDPDPDPEPEPERVGVVTADPAAPGSDGALVSRLRDAGYEVSLLDDDTTTATSTAGLDAVLVTATVSQSALRDRLRAAVVPVVVWKPSLYDDLALSTGLDGASVRTRQVAVTDEAHPLAAGLTGTRTLTTTLERLPVGVPRASAAVVARAGTEATLFSYDAGAPLVGGQAAPACRVAVPVPPSGVAALTTDGLALLDRAVRRAVSGCP